LSLYTLWITLVFLNKLSLYTLWITLVFLYLVDLQKPVKLNKFFYENRTTNIYRVESMLCRNYNPKKRQRKFSKLFYGNFNLIVINCHYALYG
ncbi:hypothetical protein T4A_922, partial [Trichinella pseudospiralis]